MRTQPLAVSAISATPIMEHAGRAQGHAHVPRCCRRGELGLCALRPWWSDGIPLRRRLLLNAHPSLSRNPFRSAGGHPTAPENRQIDRIVSDLFKAVPVGYTKKTEAFHIIPPSSPTVYPYCRWRSNRPDCSV